MASNLCIEPFPTPDSGILCETIKVICETIDAASSVPVQKENFKRLLTFLERIGLVLKELSKFETVNESLISTVETLKQEIEVIKELSLGCRNSSKIYLLLNCLKIVKCLEATTREIGRILGIVTSCCVNVSSETTDQLRGLGNDMLLCTFQVSVEEAEILEKIELGIRERNTDRSYANDLLNHIAGAVGILTFHSELKKEFEDFRRDLKSIRDSKDVAEALRMEQIVLLLGNADMITSTEEKEKKYLTKRNSLGRQLVEPLQSFYCPITGDIMMDPVETTSGQTFEKEAIEKWLMEGNHFCPLTKTPLSKSDLRPNKTLRQSIEEWRNRNKIITIASLKRRIQMNDESETLVSLETLLEICQGNELQREWIILENFTPILINILFSPNQESRRCSLSILCNLAKENDESKERIASEYKAIEPIVRCLARKPEESKCALQLLLELCKSNVVRDLAGRVQGCILLLVTISNSDDTEAAEYAEKILETLSFLDQNVIQMARLNYFQPLLQHLCSDQGSAQIAMAKALTDAQLSDQSKLSLLRGGALNPLLKFFCHSDMEKKVVAIEALLNLSTVAENGLMMIKEGAVEPLFELLFCDAASPLLCEKVAAILMHLSLSRIGEDGNNGYVPFLESQEQIFKLFSLVSLSGSEVQQSILHTFCAMCQSPVSGYNVRTRLRKICAVKVLVHLCELDNCKVRANAVKLFYCLTEDGDDGTFSKHVNDKCIGTLVGIMKTSDEEEEIAATLGIISNLPKESKISLHLHEAGALQAILDCLNNHASKRTEIVENATAALCRFALPVHPEWQKEVAEAGAIPVLVNLLESGNSLTKKHVAILLKQFSERSSGLSTPVRQGWGIVCCFSSNLPKCPLHSGYCTIESSYCLLEANAPRPLAKVLEEPDAAASEASLDALLTLIEGEQLQNGCKVLAEAKAITPIIKMLSSDSSRLQEKALRASEKIFRVLELKQKYGSSAQMPLVEIAQKGSGDMKSLAGRVLAHLNLLPEQSSFF
nr:U-box domain-containing protein 44-like [Ipomoea batatas]